MSINNTEIRLLLAIWGLVDSGEKPLKDKFFPSFSGKDKDVKKAEYKEAFQALIDGGAIALSNKNYALTDAGLQRLAEGLRSPDFSFQGATLVSSRLANAALRWFQKNSGEAVSVESAPKISNYDEFKAVALETYERLNYENNYDKLVPVYAIRRDIGDRVTRTQFNDWMLEMHRTDILRLHSGGSMDASKDELTDSIYSDLLNTYYFYAEVFA
jgi:hypothetical protein